MQWYKKLRGDILANCFLYMQIIHLCRGISKNNHGKSTGTEPIQQVQSDPGTEDITDVSQESETPELFETSASAD